MRAGELLRPVNAAIYREVASAGYMQVDESPVPVSDPDLPGTNGRGWWWTYSNPHGSVSYEFARTRGHAAAVDRLQSYHGKLQTDGYAVYDQFKHEDLIYLGCWAHARRPFQQLATVLKTDAPKSTMCRHAIGIVEAIGNLYAHERTMREANAPRRRHRQCDRIRQAPWSQSQGLPRRRPPPSGQWHHLRRPLASPAAWFSAR